MSIGTIAKGSTKSFPMQVTGPDGSPSVDFAATDSLVVTLWPGDDRSALITPTAEWDPVLGPPDYLIYFAPPDTASLEPGTYRIRATATRGADSPEILRDTIEVLAIPAAAIAAPVYCTFSDMKRHCSWVGQYLDTDEDQFGFAEQRAMARDWMDNLILRAVPVAGGLNLVSRQNYWTWTSNAGSGYYGTGLAVDQVIKGYLDAGALVLAGPNGSKVVRACACYALALVFGAQPDASARKDAGRYMAMAQSEASTLIAELDSNADGVSEYAFNLGTTNTRFG
jgi:hypothetical protein